VTTERKVVVLGANSFSGQDFVDLLLGDDRNRVVGVSRSPERSRAFLRYKERSNLSRYRYAQLDMNKDMPGILELLDAEKPEWIVNFAAQSEVAPSWDHPEHWFQTNTVALANLVNHLRKRDYVRRYLHVSSPEVYGTCEGVVKEDAPLNPSTPYAASKASADHLVRAAFHTYGLPVLITNCSNNYGPYQFPEKLIPLTLLNAVEGRELPLYGDGLNVRDWLYVEDHCAGILLVLERGRLGEKYNIGGRNERTNLEIVDGLCAVLEELLPARGNAALAARAGRRLAMRSGRLA